jgi:hypothetical protein
MWMRHIISELQNITANCHSTNFHTQRNGTQFGTAPATRDMRQSAMQLYRFATLPLYLFNRIIGSARNLLPVYSHQTHPFCERNAQCPSSFIYSPAFIPLQTDFSFIHASLTDFFVCVGSHFICKLHNYVQQMM